MFQLKACELCGQEDLYLHRNPVDRLICDRCEEIYTSSGESGA